MAIFASTTLGTSDPNRAQSIKALEARAQALAQAQAEQKLPPSLPSPWQGAGYLANTVADTVNAKRADQAAAQRRQDLAGYIAKAGDNPTMADVGQITAADTDVGKAYLAEIQQRRLATQKAADDRAYLAEQDRLAQAHAQTPEAKLTADLNAGRISKEDFDAGMKTLHAGSASEQKLAAEQQKENIDLQASNQGLDQALELLKTGKVYSDSSLANLRTEFGQSVPKPLQGIAGVDPESTDISKRYSQLIKTQILPIMNSLKGSLSNADREWAISTLDNPSSTIQAKQDVLNMLKVRLAAHLKQSNINLEQSGRPAVQVEKPVVGAGTPATADPLAEARKAIAAGAPKDKVIERLKAKGIDASGL